METGYIIPLNVSYRRVGEEMFILDRNGTSVFNLNAVAAVVWEGIDHGKSIDTIITEIGDRFEVDIPTARHDVDELLGDLVKKNLLRLG